MENIIMYVMMEMKWSPDVIGDLFVDEQDHKGLLMWNSEIERLHKQIKSATNP